MSQITVSVMRQTERLQTSCSRAVVQQQKMRDHRQLLVVMDGRQSLEVDDQSWLLVGKSATSQSRSDKYRDAALCRALYMMHCYMHWAAVVDLSDN